MERLFVKWYTITSGFERGAQTLHVATQLPYLLLTSASGHRLVPCCVDTHNNDGFLKGSESASGSKDFVIVDVAQEISVSARDTCVEDVVTHEVRHATMVFRLQTRTAATNT